MRVPNAINNLARTYQVPIMAICFPVYFVIPVITRSYLVRRAIPSPDNDKLIDWKCFGIKIGLFFIQYF